MALLLLLLVPDMTAFGHTPPMQQGGDSTTPYRRSDIPQVIRVGWYDYGGFYMKDSTGYRSGYAYDYLQEMARYGGWRYEYVEASVADCMQMLQDGRIDLLGSVMYTPAREAVMEYSAINMGRNFSVLTVRTDDSRYWLNDWAHFEGIHIGILKNDARLRWLDDYARGHGFSFTTSEYETPALAELALKEKHVDAILTTNMRVASGSERIIAQFTPVDFFLVAKKGNRRIMDAVDAAMEQIEFSRKGFQAELAQKYFSVDLSASLTFTEEEKAFIKSHPVIRVSCSGSRKPVSYTENGQFRGVVADILAELEKRIGVTFECVGASSQEGATGLVQSGEADMLAHVYDAYGWAELNKMLLSRPYIRLDYVAMLRKGDTPDRPDLRVAAVRGYRFSQDFVLKHYDASRIAWYDSEEECIAAVNEGARDVCFVSSYVAAEYLQRYAYRNLYSSMINYSHGVSFGLSTNESTSLLSILDKGIASMGQATINKIVVDNTMFKSGDFSFEDVLSRYPMQFIAISGTFSVVTISLGALLVISRYRRKKNMELYLARLAAERDALTGLYNRLYFELSVSDWLAARKTARNAFVMLDVDDFKNINDMQGHSQGDKTLVALAEGLRTLFPEEALLCRMGGDEFAVFLPDIASSNSVTTMLLTAQEALRQGVSEGIPVACSIGLAFSPEQGSDFVTLYEAADAALYSAKRNGKGRLCVDAMQN